MVWSPPISTLEEEEEGRKDHPEGTGKAMASPAGLMLAQKRQRMERHEPKMSLVTTHCPACSGSTA